MLIFGISRHQGGRLTDSTRGPIRIVVADDHTVLREALCSLLDTQPDFEIAGQAGTGFEVADLTSRTKPDIVLLDIEMPESKPLGTVWRIREAWPNARVVILSMHAQHQLIQELIEIGARGYLHKSISQDDLAAAIRAVARDPERVVISVAREGMKIPGLTMPNVLSQREREVLSLAAAALSNRQIASQLSITEGTVKLHMRSIFRKLGAVSRLDAANKAITASLISRPAVAKRTHA